MKRAFSLSATSGRLHPCPTSSSSPPSSPPATSPWPSSASRTASARGLRHQVLLGATGTGKTFTIARVIEKANRPTLVLAHNKTLAAQLYTEFRDFFPDNAVEYFVSYFDYYQPEAYLPRSRHVHREGLAAATRRSTSSATRPRRRSSSGAT